MGVFTRGDIVLVKFPFSDLSQTKLRPAVVLTQGEYNDVMLCQITSQNQPDKKAVEITASDFESGSLRIASYARPFRITVVAQSLIVKRIAALKVEKHKEIVEAIIKLLNSGN